MFQIPFSFICNKRARCANTAGRDSIFSVPAKELKFQRNRKILVQVCGHDWSTLRVEPPLIVSAEACRTFVSALKNELDWIHANG